MNDRASTLRSILLALVPDDGLAIGNAALRERFMQAAGEAGLAPGDADFEAGRAALIRAGVLTKGKGRGGSVRRAGGVPAGEDAQAFELAAQAAPAAQGGKQPRKARQAARPPRGAPEAAGQILSYRHQDKRRNNPEVGLVNEESDPEAGRTAWAYDPHIDPALQFDAGRAAVEKLIDDALASGDADAMRAALQELKRDSEPYLNWAGKAERTSFDVDLVSLHVHERIDPLSILSALRREAGGAPGAGEPGASGRAPGTRERRPAYRQPGLFEAEWENVPLREAIDFYRHERGWANRLVCGDSLLVMNSLLQKESMAGQVQMIYIDPPYGIKYGSNFQPFVNKRDVKDRKDEDLTQEPEMIKAFRDTWELGIHSYLTYLRDRLLLARELLSESGSVFVQISDENLHHVRQLMDEIFRPENYRSLIAFTKTTGLGTDGLADRCDYILWYARDKEKLKFRPQFLVKEPGQEGAQQYEWVESQDGARIKIGVQSGEMTGRVFNHDNITSFLTTPHLALPFDFNGDTFAPATTTQWKTTRDGLARLRRTRRLIALGRTLRYVRFLDDFPVVPYTSLWSDTGISGFGDPKTYVVQTSTKVIERCLLMTTDPGDLVLDPTCGSGTTAFVAEKWGRRWITCDTSRVAVTLAKQRLMTASYDYYELRYPQEGLRGGFIYKTVPHVTLKSIANNPEIDEIWARMHPAIVAALADLNKALVGWVSDARASRNPPNAAWDATAGGLRGKAANPPYAFTVTEGARKGQTLQLGASGAHTLPTGEKVAAGELLEWEVPFDFPEGWPEAARAAFDALHAARRAMQKQMDASIAAHADSETLYDQPEKSKTKLRISGPFTVEAVPFPTVLALDEVQQPQEADAAIARSGESSRQHRWRDELLKTGIRGKGGQMLKFASLETLPGTACLHASGTLDSGERVVVSFGPEHAALEQRQVEHALREAAELFPLPKMIVFCAFAFDPEAAKDIDSLKGITALKAQMNTDLLTEDLKKSRASNQSFWLMGQPDVELRRRPDGLYEVEVNGFDYFDTARGELVSGGKGRIAMWLLDTDYDDRSLFPRQVFFPLAGRGEGWEKLKRDIRAELDESLLEKFHGTVSLPFEAGEHRKAAVKIVDDRGIESLKIIALEGKP